MGFYRELSRHYDELFPAGAAEADFLAARLADRKRVLDIGCGTGNKTQLLAGTNREIVAFDLDPDMIEAAESRHRAPGIRYLVLDMRNMAEALSGESFDAAICLGNTLVHLANPGELDRFLLDLVRILAPGGLFATQIINYDRIVRDGVLELPAIDKPGLRFVRRYDWNGEKLRFTGELSTGRGEPLVNSVVLRPLLRDELAESLARAGFAAVDWRGGYDGKPYDGDSYHLIAVARRSNDPNR